VTTVKLTIWRYENRQIDCPPNDRIEAASLASRVNGCNSVREQAAVATMGIWFVAAITFLTAQGVPTFHDVTQCNRTFGIAGDSTSLLACIRDERKARNALVKQWSLFSADEKAYCMRLSTTGGAGTYTDLLTCLRDAHDAQSIRERDSAVLRSHLPVQTIRASPIS
jgi:hypothetical protein